VTQHPQADESLLVHIATLFVYSLEQTDCY